MKTIDACCTHRHFVKGAALGAAAFISPGAFAPVQGSRIGELAARFDIVLSLIPEN